jgi:hypothetical protein
MLTPARFIPLDPGHFLLSFILENEQCKYFMEPAIGLQWAMLTSQLVPVSAQGQPDHDEGAYTLLCPDGKVLSYCPDEAVIYESIKAWLDSLKAEIESARGM